MSQQLGIDWYSIYKINSDYLNLVKFNQSISHSNIGYGIDKVSLQYRKKLLILFQNASIIMKEKVPEIQMDNNQLFIERNNLSEMIYVKQEQVERSFKEISNLKFMLGEKQRTLTKLKDKLKKGYKKNQKTIYYCCYCQRKDFYSAEELKSHISDSHQENAKFQKQKESNYQVNQLKDLLMTMKDKEIEMMSMFLRASKQMQFQKIEKQYEDEYKKAMHISITKTDESKQEPVELRGESKFLFFPKEQRFKSQEHYQKRNTNNQNINDLNKQFYQGNYYNIFKNINQNVSEHIDDKQNTEDNVISRSNYNHDHHNSKQFLSKIAKRSKTIQESKISFVEDNPKPLLEFKPNKYLEKEQIFHAPSISDRLRELNKQKQTNMNTIFSTKRKFYEDSGYIFNSGPLLDDKGGDSDYQDYFTAYNNEQIKDEQIKFQSKKNHSYSSNKESFQFNKLLSPKQSNSFISRSDKQKSALIDLSDSFSKKDFQISKDDLTINLSDLKLSKLQRKRQQDRVLKSQVSNSMLQSKSKQDQGKMNKETFLKNKNGYTQYHKNTFNNTQRQQSDVLKDFERKKISPLTEENYYVQQKIIFHKSFQVQQKANLIHKNQSNQFQRQSKTGILNEFMKKQLKVYPNLTKQADKLQFERVKK